MGRRGDTVRPGQGQAPSRERQETAGVGRAGRTICAPEGTSPRGRHQHRRDLTLNPIHAGLEGGRKAVGWQRWRPQPLPQNQNYLLVAAQEHYGIVRAAECSMVCGEKLTHVPPGIGRRQDWLSCVGFPCVRLPADRAGPDTSPASWAVCGAQERG
ncbi:MAG: hypothetical protein ACREOH_16365, partial [Candidatus Entotheonellia bacterium]